MRLEKIPANAKLVIIDFYGTLTEKTEEGWKFRNSFDAVFGFIIRLRLRGKKIAISSGSPIEEISSFPRYAEIGAITNGLYGKEHLFWEYNNGHRTGYKDLGEICEDLDVKPENSVFIGDRTGLDENLDERSAERFKVPFIEISSDYKLTDLLGS